MRNYECECMDCKYKRCFHFENPPYPEYGDMFLRPCPFCGAETRFTRSMTRKTLSELRKKQAELDLRNTIIARCEHHGFQYRFLYQSVIVTTSLSDWCFDYHRPRITLYHESTFKINFQTGDFAKAHIQFKERKMTLDEVIDYIAAHDRWRAQQRK